MMKTGDVMGVLRVVLGVMVVCSLVGCSGGNCSVTGTVSYDGTPIEKGNIRLMPTSDIGFQGASAEIVNGRYEIGSGTGLVNGEYTVMISAVRPETAQETAAREAANAEEEDEDEADEDEDEDEGAAPQAPVQPMTQYIPGQYNLGSTLKVTLESGENSKDFALEKGTGPQMGGGSDEDDADDED